MNVDYKSYRGCDISPDLLTVLATVFAKSPSVAFVAHRLDANNKIDMFRAYLNGHMVGSLYLVRQTRRNGMRPTVIRVESDSIQKKRGSNRNAKDTESPSVAAKICLQSFKPRPTGVVAHQLLDGANSACGVARYRAKTDLIEGWRQEESVIGLVKFVAAVKADPSTPVPQSFAEFLESRKTGERLDAFYAADFVHDTFAAKHGLVLSPTYGDMFFAVDLGDPEKVFDVKSTYDLPVNYQEKLAILKIMETDVPVLNVGLKFRYDGNAFGPSFFLTGGDTIPAG